MTYFKSNYEPQDSPLTESFEIPFDNQQANFGTTSECTIPSTYGDVLTSAFLRVNLPAIYPPQAGTYVYPSTSTSFSGALLVQKNLTYVTADGANLTANTDGSHFFSVGSNVILSGTAYSIFNLDGVYTISSIPTANSFVCSTKLAGVSYNGVVSSIGIQPAPIVGYYSTNNLDLWAQILVNLTYTQTGGQISVPNASLVPGQTILVTKTTGTLVVGSTYTVATSTGNTFTLVSQVLDSNTSSFIENSIIVTYDSLQSKFVFRSVVYPSITFANARDAAFWGFDYLQGPSFTFVNGALTSQWTLSQGGWVQGFLPPSLSGYDDSVAHKLIKEARILLGRQVIKRYTGEYLELINDLTIPYENKAILKLMNGTLDFTQSVAAREYYVSLPLGCESIPLCALTRQQISIEIDFEEYRNLSNNLNPGSGNFFDTYSYLTYNVSKNLLGGNTFNVSTTLSYQQYILILTFSGTILAYDTTQNIDSPGAYSVFTAFSGSTSRFSKFVALGNYLFIQLVDGSVFTGLLSELVQGNSSSFILNNYLPTTSANAGPPTGSMVCDFRYLYYAQSNLAQSNVFFVRYDTTAPFLLASSYTSFDFTANVSSSVSSVYQILSTGAQLIAITNTPGTFYQFNLNGNFLTDWVPISYGAYGTQITQGTLVGQTVYFLLDNSKILTYSLGVFTGNYSGVLPVLGSIRNLQAVGSTIYASANTLSQTSIIQINTTKNLSTSAAYNYYTSGKNAPISFAGNVPSIFANGPRFVYIFTNDPSQTTTPTNAIRYDPYPVNPALQASIIADYKILPPEVPKPTWAEIKYIQNQHVTLESFADLQILGPVKELIVTGTPTAANVYQYSNLDGAVSLTITGNEEIITPDVGTVTGLGVMAPFQTHTVLPVRNLSVIPFEIDPESPEPNGTINFSRLQYQNLSNGASVWALSYNILKIESGIGGLKFNSPY
jgi:hypothetical protein